ncbi:MAG: 4-hydroxy-tetrahydrodipicolinate synthase [Alphaproteobacteria bacterium]
MSRGSEPPGGPPISGVWLPLVTPFRAGAIDHEAVARLVRHYVGARVDGLIVGATTGEGLALDMAETEALTVTAAQTAAGRVPVYLGLSGSWTAKLLGTLEATRHWPVDGYLVACPYYTRPSQDGLYRHFAAIAAATDRPIVVYNIPYRTGVNLSNDTLLRLAELPNVIGVKDCAAEVAQSSELLRRRPAGFAVMTGEDVQFHLAVAQGAAGGILASAHVDPAGFRAVRDLLIAGDRTAALARWNGLVDTVRMLFSEPSPAPIKHWLWCRGLIPSPEVRLPMTPVSEKLAADIARSAAARPAA